MDLKINHNFDASQIAKTAENGTENDNKLVIDLLSVAKDTLVTASMKVISNVRLLNTKIIIKNRTGFPCYCAPHLLLENGSEVHFCHT